MAPPLLSRQPQHSWPGLPDERSKNGVGKNVHEGGQGGAAKRAISSVEAGDTGDKRRKIAEQEGGGGGGSAQKASAGAVAGDSVAGAPGMAAAAATAAAAPAAAPSSDAAGGAGAAEGAALTALWTKPSPSDPGALGAGVPVAVNSTPYSMGAGPYPGGFAAGGDKGVETKLLLGLRKGGSAMPEFELGGTTFEAAGVLREGNTCALHP
ncbi:hypothetical protein T484DRAFT_1837792 [Baffinella frigidus]|nr:hypothetical protein T484DRAFT_1837792 [Cryptophyta sp. CCMP2293]